MYTLRDALRDEERLEYAMFAPEVGVLAQGTKRERFYAYIGGREVVRKTREGIARELIRAWDKNIKTGA